MAGPARTVEDASQSLVSDCAQWLEASTAAGAQAQAREVRQRLKDRHVVVGVIGQFKRGKTSLVNAWLGQDLLPVGVLPTTGVVTRLRRGERPRALVRFLDGREREVGLAEAATYASEATNPNNERGVRELALEVVTSTLPEWVELVDTPGIGSTHGHATQSAVAYLPWIDLGMFVLSPEPPLTEDERAYLMQAREYAAKLIVVLTKSDTAPAAAIEAVRSYARAQIAQAIGVSLPCLTLSTVDEAAREHARATLDAAVREQSHVELARRGAARRLKAFIAAELATVTLETAALDTPVEERRARADRLADHLEHLRLLRNDQHPLWQAASRAAAEQVDALLAEVKSRITAAVEAHQGDDTPAAKLRQSLTKSASERLDAVRQELRLQTRDIAEAVVAKRLASLSPEVARIVEEAAGLLGATRVTFALTAPVSEERSFYFRWEEDASLLPDLRRGALVSLLPGGQVRARRAVIAAVADLVDRNVGRLAYAFRTAVQARVDEAAAGVAQQLETLDASLARAVATLRAPPDETSRAAHARLEARLRTGQELLRRLGASLQSAPSPKPNKVLSDVGPA
jgi:signal recognition particle receptor subunit beta